MQHKHSHCPPQITKVAMFHPLLAELNVSEIFTIVAHSNVDGKAKCPDSHKGEDDPGAKIRAWSTFILPLDN